MCGKEEPQDRLSAGFYESRNEYKYEDKVQDQSKTAKRIQILACILFHFFLKIYIITLDSRRRFSLFLNFIFIQVFTHFI